MKRKIRLGAFPLTPMNEQGVDENAFTRLVQQLVTAKVDSIGALGSTGSYVYLSRKGDAPLQGAESAPCRLNPITNP